MLEVVRLYVYIIPFSGKCFIQTRNSPDFATTFILSPQTTPSSQPQYLHTKSPANIIYEGQLGGSTLQEQLLKLRHGITCCDSNSLHGGIAFCSSKSMVPAKCYSHGTHSIVSVYRYIELRKRWLSTTQE